MTRYDDEDVANAIEAIIQIRIGAQVWGERDVRQVALVFAVLDHRLKQIEFDNAAKPDLAADACELQREGRTP